MWWRPVERKFDKDGNVVSIRCNTCQVMKTVDNFAKTWLSWINAYHTKCKDCKNEYDKIYREKTKERRAEKSKIYREKNHTKLLESSRKKYKENSKKYIKRSSKYRRKKVRENWFARERFHEKARKLVKKIWIEFNKCFLCNKEGKTELHHPSYETKEMRSIVVPLCRGCHRYVEQHPNECPHPIDLLLLENER